MERQTEPPINPKAKKKEEEEKGENQKTSMACIGVEIKERIGREKKKRTSRRKRWETPLYGSPEKNHGRQSVWNEWREIFSER